MHGHMNVKFFSFVAWILSIHQKSLYAVNVPVQQMGIMLSVIVSYSSA